MCIFFIFAVFSSFLLCHSRAACNNQGLIRLYLCLGKGWRWERSLLLFLARKPWIYFLLPIGSSHLHIAELFTGKGVIVEWSLMALTNHQCRISVGEPTTVSITIILPFLSFPLSLLSAFVLARLEYMGSSKDFSVGHQRWSKWLLLLQTLAPPLGFLDLLSYSG